MSVVSPPVSEIDNVSYVLARALGARRADSVIVLERRALGEGTFQSEIIKCRVRGGRAITLFCKHGKTQENFGYGHRGGPTYEAAIYRHVLRSSRCTLPVFRGSHRTGGGTWLVLGFLPDSLRIHVAPDCLESMTQAAAWIGSFQAEQESLLRKRVPPFLKRYDRNYYIGWARRTRRLSGPLHARFPWLVRLCKRYEAVAEEMAGLPQVVVHGEYYPKNILLHKGAIYPVDWESAAIGFGEIDLVCLTDFWSRTIAKQCEIEYARRRWPRGVPPDYQRRLALARLYVHLRWLGDLPDWTLKTELARYPLLYKAAKQLDLVP